MHFEYLVPFWKVAPKWLAAFRVYPATRWQHKVVFTGNVMLGPQNPCLSSPVTVQSKAISSGLIQSMEQKQATAFPPRKGGI